MNSRVPAYEFQNKVVVAGVGYSEIGRSTGRSEGSLAIEACNRAITDAGMTPGDVDGIAAWPDRISSVFEGPPLAYVHRALGLESVRYWQAFGAGPGQLSSVIGAVHAIAAGAADVVLCYRAHLRQETRFYVPGGVSAQSVTGDMALRAPYGLPAGTPRYALWAQRHAYERGYTDEDRGAVVLTCREHAQLNPRAVWYGKPLTMDEYLRSDIIASPLRILDCDMPIDGAVAAVLTAADRVPDLPKRPVYVNAMASCTGPTLDSEAWPDMSSMASRYAANEMWGMTDLGPKDVDVAQIYDGFSSLTLSWLEDMGFVGPGESGDFLREGRGGLGGDLPICTDGGSLGGGRLHGFSKLAEAVEQLRGECGQRQVEGAQVAAVCNGGGPIAATFLLTA
jgi:acetyl-CoA acetyltransferase